MIIVDTNVVSEPLRLAADLRVIEWLDRQDPDTLFLTTTSLAELLVGVEALPDGKRKQAFSAALSTLIDRLFGDRILPFGHREARQYAALVIKARAAGKAISFADGQIAAIAAANSFAVATRDMIPFQATGLKVINPWLD